MEANPCWPLGVEHSTPACLAPTNKFPFGVIEQIRDWLPTTMSVHPTIARSILNMSMHNEYRIVIDEAQRRLIMRALTNTMANDRRSTDTLSPTADEWMQLIRLFSTIKPSDTEIAALTT